MRYKKVFLAFLLISTSSFVYGDCDELMKKYNAPDPSTKTMKQAVRWVKRKVKTSDAGALTECMVKKAADNPNKTYAAGI